MPTCARWPALVPLLAALWSGTPDAPSSYREVVIGCPPSHAKLLGTGWHRPERHVSAGSLASYADASVDEVHVCDADADAGRACESAEDCAAGNEACATGRIDWAELHRVLRPGALAQVPSGSGPPESLSRGFARLEIVATRVLSSFWLYTRQRS